MAKRSCKLNDNWFEEFKPWLEKSKDPKSVFCNICQQSFGISNMGVSAIKSHAKGKKHIDKESMRKSSSTLYFAKDKGKSKETSTTSPAACSQTLLPSVVANASATEAEIVWTIRTVLLHNSNRSCDGLPKLFQCMFPDSKIAKIFSLGRTKCGYYTNFGIAPYLKDTLISKVKAAPFYALSYDESLNRVFQEEQMDIHLRYFNEETQMVESRYFDSPFVKRPNSDNLHNELLNSLSVVDVGKLIQISMDGPNVNWDVLKKHSQHREEGEMTSLVQLGSCGLHIVHGALKTGMKESGWNIDKILHAMWKIFDESPARRDIYIRETTCDVFPLHFCKTRWVEDGPVAGRAIELWTSVTKVIKYWLSCCKSSRPQKNKSYDTLVEHHKDPLMIAKFNFFKYLASILSHFLVCFQTEKPMLPFLATELDRMLRQVYRLFIKRDVVNEAQTPYSLSKIDVAEKENHLPVENLELGSAVTAELGKVGVSSEVKKQFKKDCKKVLIKLCGKLNERSPLNFAAVRNAVAWNPHEMVNEEAICILRGKKFIQKLFDLKLLTSVESDNAKRELELFIQTVVHQNKDEFSSFNKDKQRLDTFFSKYCSQNADYVNFWKVCKIVFVLFHGQADVERGFSVNKEILVENMLKESLISQRLVCDQLGCYRSNLENYKVSRELLLRCKNAWRKYNDYLEEKKKEKVVSEGDRKRKLIREEIDEIKKKKQNLRKCIQTLEGDITKYSFEAEEKADLDLLTKANSFRKTKDEKEETIKALDRALAKLDKNLKGI